MAKPMLMTLPFLLVLLDYWPLGRFELKTKSLRLKTFVPLLAEKTPFLALAVVSGLVAVWAHNQGGKLAFREPIPVAPRVANALVSYARYLAKTLWPDHLAVFYPLPPAWPAWQVAGAVLLLAAASLAALALARRYPALFTGWFWFLGTLVPVIGFVQVGTFSLADRFTYFPLIGLFVAGAWGLGYLLNLWPQCRLLLLAAACSSLAACGWRASAQVQLWQNSETLFAHAIRVTPDNYIAYNNLGTALDHSGQTEAALECFARALRIKPDHPEAHLNLALALTGQKKYTEAVAHYEAALRFAPADAQAHNNLANLLDLLGRVAEAVPHYLAALQIKPDFPEAEYNLAGALAGQGRLQDAVAHYQTALCLAPQNASAHYNLARLLAKLGRLQEAKDHYLAALRLNPRHSSACYNLGNLLLRLGEPQEAIAHFTAALQLEPDFPKAHFSLGKTLLSQGQAEPGILHLRTALRLKPDWAPALNQLAWTLATHPLPQIRDGNQAIPLAERLCEMTGHRQPASLATLAAAYAETGQFAKAVATAQAGYNLAVAAQQPELQATLRQQIELYRSDHPFHQPAPR